jgi:hypothetical protein
MKYIAKDYVLHESLDLLIYAAKHDLKDMVWKLLHFGGDVDCREYRQLSGFPFHELQTPLLTAAYHEHEGMV